jgi:hypothetical protein
MLGGHSDKRAPYEVMGQAAKQGEGQPNRPGGEAKSSTDPAESDDQPAGAASQGTGRGLWQWAMSSAAPLVLRVPRGLAALAVAAVLGLIVLAYWVGYVQGHGAAEAQFRDGLAEQQQRGQQRPPGEFAGMGEGIGQNPGQRDAGENGAQPGNSAGPNRTRPGDPRQPGLNYFIIATWPPQSARQLASFYEGQGVDIYLQQLDNGRVEAWAVEQGFQGPNEASERFGRKLKSIGRQFADQTNWQVDDLLLAKYTPDDTD